MSLFPLRLRYRDACGTEQEVELAEGMIHPDEHAKAVARAETAERERDEAMALNEKQAARIANLERELFEVTAAHAGAGAERDEARAHVARLRAALELVWGPVHVAATEAGSCNQTALLYTTEAGSGKLWRAMERACEVADEFCAAFTIVKGPPAEAQKELTAALAAVEAAKAEEGR